MKKCLFWAAMAGVALAGCVSEEVADVNKQQEKVRIGFETPLLYSNVNTRANVFGEIGSHTYDGSNTTYTYPREEEFVIYAMQHTGNFTSWTTDENDLMGFNGDAIAWNSSVDAWLPLKDDGSYYYWPNEKRLSFAATSPAELGDHCSNVTRNYSDTGLKIENFKVADSPSEQYDLLFSKRVTNQTAANMSHSAGYYSGIPLTFQHALSSIHFSLKKDASVTETLKLTKIEITNVKNQGTFEEGITAKSTEYIRDNTVNPKWTINENPTTAKYTAFQGSVEFPIEAQYVSAIAANDTDDEEENETSHALLLLPQDLSDDVKLNITYTIGNETIIKEIQLNFYPNESSATAITKWEIGKRYTYRLSYSTSTQHKDIIYFSPSTDGWDPVDVIVINL